MTIQLLQVNTRSLVAGLDDAETTGDIAHILFRVSDAFSFSAVTLMVMPARTDKAVSGLVLETQLPAGFYDEVDQLGGADGCLLFDNLRQTILPITWTIEGMRQRYRNLGREVPAVASLYDRHQLTMGVALPVHTVDGVRHVIRFDGHREPLTAPALNELTMLSMQVFDAYDRLHASNNNLRTSLTARELEVVHWTAAGKTSVEIGLIMELSDHTVNAYMNNAFKKLNCVNRQQLVAKALRMRVIS